MPAEPVSAKQVRCPRCGYDQRGPIATWTEFCPLEGTCSECGLNFNWAEVIHPEKFEPHWCVEFVRRRRGIPFACVKTFFRSFWPWTFWSRLKMSQPIRKWRIVLYALSLLLPLVMSYVIAQASAAAYMRYTVQQQNAAWPQQIAWAITWHQGNLQALQTADQLRQMTSEEREQALSALGPGIVGNASQYRMNVEHCLSLQPEQLTSSIQQLQQTIDSLQAQPMTVPVINHSYLAAMTEAVIFPLRQYSWGTIQFPDGTVQPYPAPIETVEYFMDWWSNQTAIWRGDLHLRVAVGILCTILLTALLPICFVLLPASRRRAKVRWPHVWRIFCYSLFAPVTMLLAMCIAAIMMVVADSSLAAWVARWAILTFWMLLPLWWAVAIKRYLKMPHAAAIAGLMALMLALLMSPLLMVVLPEWIVRMVLD